MNNIKQTSGIIPFGGDDVDPCFDLIHDVAIMITDALKAEPAIEAFALAEKIVEKVDGIEFLEDGSSLNTPVEFVEMTPDDEDYIRGENMPDPLLDLVMSNGKKLRDCTGVELKQVGNFYIELTGRLLEVSIHEKAC